MGIFVDMSCLNDNSILSR